MIAKKHLLKGILFLITFLIYFSSNAFAYDKKTLVERFTNCSCGPCATLNAAWYNATTASLINSGLMTHIVYNGDWPSPGECDPMHLLNQVNNNARISYYGVNSVPWIEINASTFNNNLGSSGFTTAVNQGNAEYSPFMLTLIPERFSNDVIDVRVIIHRDPTDTTIFGDLKLRVALTEKVVEVHNNSCCSNGETQFYSVCRTMLPHAQGSDFLVPAPGDSTEISLQFIPTNVFLDAVNLDSIRVVAFIQDDDDQEVFQSVMEDLTISNRLNAAFSADETMGASPLMVTFSDYSTPDDTTNIISWAWDFDNDGTIDSNDPEPTWTFTDEQAYTVSLTVSDGNEQHTRTFPDYIWVVGNTSDILVVNGINYETYGTEMENFYNNSAGFGNHQVDLWDLFGDQGFDYSANPNIVQVNLFNRNIPSSVLNLYNKVIWIGNSYLGDEAFYDPLQVLDYIGQGGNFLLATREGDDFFNTELKDYCGITSISGLFTVTNLIALDDSLVDMAAVGTNSRVQYAWLDTLSEAIPIFDTDTINTWIAGFRIKKDGEGGFVYIAGRPYRYNNNASYQNYDYIIDNWLSYIPVSVEDHNSGSLPTEYALLQNYPNPFNPNTTIQFRMPKSGLVSLKIYDVVGQEVAVLVNSEYNAGEYSVKFNASRLSSGLYIYRISAGEFSSSKKMILIK